MQGGIPERLALADPSILNLPQEISAEPVSQKIWFTTADYLASISALESAISQLRHNLTNSATPGYKRLRITLVDAYGSSPSKSIDSTVDPSIVPGAQGEGCRTAPVMLDLKQGILKKTARPLDLAIDGEGFFVVRRGEKEYLTRCGAFSLDHQRQVCLAVTSDTAIVQPVLRIPEDAREIQISAEGIVTALKAGSTGLETIGQLRLARVASPERLQPIGNTLFVANESSGAIVLGSPMANGLGEIQQGLLEHSNVEFDRELEEIEELVTILKSLPTHTPRPATANVPRNSFKR